MLLTFFNNFTLYSDIFYEAYIEREENDTMYCSIKYLMH
jgi:hypothetical protein